MGFYLQDVTIILVNEEVPATPKTKIPTTAVNALLAEGVTTATKVGSDCTSYQDMSHL